MTSTQLRIALFAGLVLVGLCAADSAAQVPGSPPPKAGPRTRPPKVNPSPRPSDARKRARTKRRREEQGRETDSPARPAGTTSGPKPAAPKRPSPAETRRATRLVETMAGTAKRLRDESWSGEATLIDRLGTRSKIPVRVTRAWRAGECRALVVHGREGDLPELAHLFVVDAKGKSRGWTWKPEERKTAERAGIDERIGRSALAYVDLVGYDPARHALVYEESTILDGKKALRFHGTPLSKRPHARALFDMRGDYKLVGRVRLFRDGEDAWREVRFSDVKHVGVFRRWMSLVVIDHERSATAVVKIKERRVNRGVDFEAFTAAGLPDLLAP